MTLPQDQLLRAAHSWSIPIETYLAERNEAWTSRRYEDLVSRVDDTLAELFTFLAIDDDRERERERAATLPREPTSNFYVVKRMFAESSYQNEIIDAVRPGCAQFGYDPSPDELPSDVTAHYLEVATLQHQRARMKRLWHGVGAKFFDA
jgi:alanine racemase